MPRPLQKNNKISDPAASVHAQPEDDEIDLTALLGTLWRGRLVILFCAVLLTLIAGFYAFRVAVPKYRSTASLALEIRTENVVDLESVVSGASTEGAAINTELEVIRSTGLLEELVRELDLTEDPEFNARLRPEPAISLAPVRAAIREFLSPEPVEDTTEATADDPVMRNTIASVRGAISATNQRDTYVFLISATTTSPRKSERMANTLADLYIQDQINQKFNATENAVAWLSERVVDLEAELATRQDEIKALTAQSDVLSEEGLLALGQQSRDLRDRLAQTEASAATLRSRLERVQASREAGELGAVAETYGDATLRSYAPDAAEGDPVALETFNNRLELLISRDETSLERTEQQASALQESYARLEQQIATQTDSFEQLQQLQREAEATRTLYETFLARLKETTVQRGLQQADSRVLSRAVPGTYIEPAKTRILALGFILGAMIGCGIVLARQMLHSGFRDPETLENTTGLAVLGQIPKLPVRRRRELIDYLSSKPTSAAAEAVRNLRTSVLLSNLDETPQIIMSTSSVPGEGKTTQAIALAHNLAGLGKRVLLIEADIRRRTFKEYFDFGTSRGGLVSVLSGDLELAEAVVRDPRMEVDVLRGEKAQVNAADLFSSDRFREFLDGARNEYDFIVVDTPPVLVVPDSRVIAQHVDVTMFTVAWDKTGRGQVSEALRQFSSVGIDVSGLVLAQIDPKGMKRYGYGGKYGAYSAYGRGYYDAS